MTECNLRFSNTFIFFFSLECSILHSEEIYKSYNQVTKDVGGGGLVQLLKADKLSGKARFLRIFSQVSPSSENWEDFLVSLLCACLFMLKKHFCDMLCVPNPSFQLNAVTPNLSAM